MKEFKSIEEARTLAEDGKYWLDAFQAEKVKITGKEVWLCGTDQVYDCPLWGGVYNGLEELFKNLGLEANEHIDIVEYASVFRDEILKQLEEDGFYFEELCEEY